MEEGNELSDKEAVVLIGYGGHASVLLDLLREGARSVRGYFDRAPRTSDPFELKFLGDEAGEGAAAILALHPYLVGVGDNHRREAIVAWAEERGYRLAPAAIHVQARVAGGTSIGAGTMVGVQAVVNPGATVGRAVILNTSSVVEHDAVIEDFCHIAPGAIVLGGAHVGAGSLIGSGAVVLPGVRIGRGTTVGAGAVVTGDVEGGKTVMGIPAR